MENNILKKHINLLKKEVFFTQNKWPHFELLFKDLTKFSKNQKIRKIISLERGSLYGNISLFAPLFNKKEFTSIECGTKRIRLRGAYNKKFVKNKHILQVPTNLISSYKNLNLKSNSSDLIIIPNLIHHIFDHQLIIKQCKKNLKKNGILYIFEPTLREIHQKPDDYFRFTPYSLRIILKQIGFKKIKIKFCGGPFSAAYYCLDQASQYIPIKQRETFKKKYMRDYKKFFDYDKKFKKNLVRKNTIFPMSFSISATV